MKIDVIASGSKGNCYRISDGTTSLLLEAGIPIKDIRRGCGFKLNEISGALISHSHKDHCKSVKDLLHFGLNVYAPLDVYQALGITEPMQIALPKHIIEIGSFNVLPFECEHDVPNNGYLIGSRETGEKLLFATDTYYIKYKFRGLTHIMAECNYDDESLDQNANDGRIPHSLKRRLYGSHMNFDTFMDMLRANDLSGVKQIYLLHLSDNNSNAEKYKKAVQELTGAEVCIA